MSKTSLEKQDSQLATVQQPSVALMLQGVIEKGITSENVSALEALVGLYERMEARNAKQAYAAAFVELQQDIPKVQATKAVPNNDGTVRYKYAPYEEIMKQVQPMLTRHGFTVDFDMKVSDGGKVTSLCKLTHTEGHSETKEYTVRVGRGAPGTNEMQADAGANSYAKRGALTNSLNIIVSHEVFNDDANNEGGPITKQQADNLRERVKATGSDEARFLAFAGADTFETIGESHFDALDEFLHKKEMKNARPITKTNEKEPGETGADLF